MIANGVDAVEVVAESRIIDDGDAQLSIRFHLTFYIGRWKHVKAIAIEIDVKRVAFCCRCQHGEQYQHRHK